MAASFATPPLLPMPLLLPMWLQWLQTAAATALCTCFCQCYKPAALSTAPSAPPCAAGGPYVARWFNWLLNVSPNEALPLGHTLKNPAFGGSTSGTRQAGAAERAVCFARPLKPPAQRPISPAAR